jgi:hypothetical protein
MAKKDEVRAKLQRVTSMLDADVLCQEIETSKLAATDAEEVEVAIEIFKRLNSGGANLSGGDVAAAQLAQETTSSILGPMRDFAKRRTCVAVGLNFPLLTRALSTVRHRTARVSKLPKNWTADPPRIEQSWNTQNAFSAMAMVSQVPFRRAGAWRRGPAHSCRWYPSN